MSAHWPVGFPKNVMGSGDSIPLAFDQTMNYPRRIFTLEGADTYNLTPGSWCEIAGDVNQDGWTFQPQGAQGPSLALRYSACFPVTKDGALIIDAAGSGVVVVIEWPPEIGARIATSRGYAPPQSGTSASGSASTPCTPLVGKAYDGSGPAAYDPVAVPGTGRRLVQIGLDTGTPPGLNDPTMVFCLADTAANSKAGVGIVMVPGGDEYWPGGPAFITEIAAVLGAPNSYSQVIGS